MDPEPISWDGQQQLTHYEETNSYTLEIKLIEERLTITLTDIINGIVYSRTYTETLLEEEIGKGYDDLFDVLMVFMPPHEVRKQLKLSDERREEAIAHSARTNYSFGEKIINEKAEYSIHQYGVIKIACEFERGERFMICIFDFIKKIA